MFTFATFPDGVHKPSILFRSSVLALLLPVGTADLATRLGRWQLSRHNFGDTGRESTDQFAEFEPGTLWNTSQGSDRVVLYTGPDIK